MRQRGTTEEDFVVDELAGNDVGVRKRLGAEYKVEEATYPSPRISRKYGREPGLDGRQLAKGQGSHGGGYSSSCLAIPQPCGRASWGGGESGGAERRRALDGAWDRWEADGNRVSAPSGGIKHPTPASHDNPL